VRRVIADDHQVMQALASTCGTVAFPAEHTSPRLIGVRPPMGERELHGLMRRLVDVRSS
jgi:hypothetical protein